jgi:hypothetical protein
MSQAYATNPFYFYTPNSPPAANRPASDRRIKIAVWLEQDEMRQAAIGSKAIPRRFRVGKETHLPHCSREH